VGEHREGEEGKPELPVLGTKRAGIDKVAETDWGCGMSDQGQGEVDTFEPVDCGTSDVGGYDTPALQTALVRFGTFAWER
jgi:hypothetical protein